LAGTLFFVYAPLFGVWRERRLAIQGALVYVAMLFGLMSLAFSVVSWRNSFLHSLVAMLPILYVLAPAGLAAAIAAIARRRRTWNPKQAERFFCIAYIGIAVLLSLFFYLSNVYGDDPWNRRFAVYQQVEQYLRDSAHDTTQPVMCINP